MLQCRMQAALHLVTGALAIVIPRVIATIFMMSYGTDVYIFRVAGLLAVGMALFNMGTVIANNHDVYTWSAVVRIGMGALAALCLMLGALPFTCIIHVGADIASGVWTLNALAATTPSHAGSPAPTKMMK